jgi:hypothetical protein
MRCNRNAGAAQQPRSPTILEAQRKQELEDQKFEERKRIAEHLVRALREAGYSRDLGDNAASPPTLRRDD